MEKIEAGKSYKIKVKSTDSESPDVVFVRRRSENSIGEQFFVVGCYPNHARYDPGMMRPDVAWNLDEHTDKLQLDDEGTKIQQQRFDLHKKLNNLCGQQRQLRKDLLDSFVE